MEQPPPVPGQVAHPGLTAAARAYSTDRSGPKWAALLAQLRYGYVLLDSAPRDPENEADPAPGVPAGGATGTGPAIPFRSVPTEDGGRGLAVFSSQTEIQAGLPAAQRNRVVGFIQTAPDLAGLLASQGFDALVLDPGSANVTLTRESLAQVATGPNDPGVRTALELGAGTRLAIIDALVHHDGTLCIAAPPASLGPAGLRPDAKIRTSRSPGGGNLVCLFTSPVELALRHPNDVPVPQTYDTALLGCLAEGYDGVIINPGSSWIILTKTEVQSALTRRRKLAARAAKKKDAKSLR